MENPVKGVVYSNLSVVFSIILATAGFYPAAAALTDEELQKAALFWDVSVESLQVPIPDEAASSTMDAAAQQPPLTVADIPLTIIADAEMGYSISIPVGSKTLRKSRFGHTYSLVLAGGLHEYNVNLTSLDVSSLDDAKSTAVLADQAELELASEITDGYIVIKKPSGIGQVLSIQEVWVFKRGNNKSVTAKCTGPTGQLNNLRAICDSLSVE